MRLLTKNIELFGTLNKKWSISFYLYFSIIFNLIVLFSSCSNNENAINTTGSEKIKLEETLSNIDYPTDSIQILLENAISTHNMMSISILCKELGKRMRYLSDFSKAIEYHQQGLNAAYLINDTIEIVQGLNNLGTDFRRIGAMAEASDYHYRALQTIEAYSDKDDFFTRKYRVMAINGLGNIHLTFDNFDEAEKLFKEALDVERELNSDLGMAINYANIGAIYEEKNMYDSAFIYFQRSMEHNVLAQSELGIGLCYIHFGRLYEQQNEYDKAEREYLLAYDVMNGISDKWHWLEATLAIARINLIKNEFYDFLKFIEMAEGVAIEIESPEHLSSIYNLKHKYSIETGNFASALENFKMSKMFQDSIHNLQKLNQIIDLRMNYERDKNRRYIADLNTSNDLEIQQKTTIIRAYIVSVIMLILLSGALFYVYIQRTKSNKMLRNLNQIRNTFFTNITHEFRTPLTVILGLSKHMQTSHDLEHEETVSFMKAIEKQGRHLMKLVNQLLNMSKINAGMDNPQWYKGDIVAYVRMVVDSFKLYARSKNLKLIFSHSESSLEMEFVPNYINDIVQNLISNAVKFSLSGEEIFVDVSTIKNKHISISIADSGVGINENDLEHIFNLFYQGGNSKESTGSGIGLSYAKQMVEYMNGKIEVESIEGKGTRFIIQLPRYQNEENKLPFWNENEDKAPDYFRDTRINKPEDLISISTKLHSKESKEYNRHTILLIEDNEDVILYLKSLIPSDYNVITACDGKEGLEVAKEIIPDIIVSDIMMPHKDGLSLCSDIRNSTLLNHIPIILLTAKSSHDDWMKGLKHGADAYIMKPFNFQELLTQIETLLDNRKLLKDKYQNVILNSGMINNNNDVSLEFLQKAIDIVYSEMHNSDFTTVSLAERLSVSSSQLNRKLSAVSGYTPSIFINSLKIEYAKRKLVTDNKPIGQIAEECGFSDIAYFSRTFKKITSYSPSQFRRLPK